jgi:hypothetical protein
MSYSTLHASIRKQIQNGKVFSDRDCGKSGSEINQWIEASKNSLILMEDRVPTLLREFNNLSFWIRLREDDIRMEVVEEKGCFKLVEVEDEFGRGPSRSWFRDEGDQPYDLNFFALQRVVELLELANEKLQLDSPAAHNLSPKQRAKTPSASSAPETAVDSVIPSATRSPSAEGETEIGGDGNFCNADPAPISRREMVNTFLLHCSRETGLKLCRKHIWQSVLHTSSRQFQYWQKCDPKATAQDCANFSRVLAMTPAEFKNDLKMKNLMT